MNFLKRIFTRSAQTPEELMTLLSGGGKTRSNVVVNPDTAQGLPAVYCAVNTIADAVLTYRFTFTSEITKAKRKGKEHTL